VKCPAFARPSVLRPVLAFKIPQDGTESEPSRAPDVQAAEWRTGPADQPRSE